MIRSVVWSSRAKNDYFEILEYLDKHWNRNVTIRYIERVDTVISTIQASPQLFPTSSDFKKVRRCVVTKHTTLYYRIINDKIQLITLFDSRHNPEKRNLS